MWSRRGSAMLKPIDRYTERVYSNKRKPLGLTQNPSEGALNACPPFTIN